MGFPDYPREIKEHLDLVEIVSEYVQLRREGPRYVGLCPFHSEKTPSFKVTPEKGIYYCFGCHAKGDIFQFIMDIEKMSFRDALQFLAKKAGIEIRMNNRGRDDGKRAALLELNNKVSGSFSYILANSPEGKGGLAYLRQRGLNQDTIQRFELGFSPGDANWLASFLLQKGYSEDFLKQSGLFTHTTLRALFRNRIMFPIKNARGDVIAFGGRTLSDTEPQYKYINSPESPIYKKRENLYGLNYASTSIRERGEFIIVEGYLDVLAMHQKGYTNCIAPLGTALTEIQLRLLKRYSTHGILLFDADLAGSNAARKTIVMMENNDMESEVALLPDGLDPADTLLEKHNSIDGDLLKERISGFQFLLESTLSTHHSTGPTESQAVLNSLLPFLRATKSDVKRDAYFHLIASSLNTDVDFVRKDYARSFVGQLVKEKPSPPEITISTDLYLMIAVTANLEYFSEVRQTLKWDNLKDERARKLFLSIEECFRNEQAASDCVLARIDDDSLKQLLYQKISSDEFTINQKDTINDSVNKILFRNLIEKRDRVIALLRKSETDEPWKIKNLLEEKMILDDQIEELKVR